MSSLRRTQSYLILPGIQNDSPQIERTSSRSLRPHNDRRDNHVATPLRHSPSLPSLALHTKPEYALIHAPQPIRVRLPPLQHGRTHPMPTAAHVTPNPRPQPQPQPQPQLQPQPPQLHSRTHPHPCHSPRATSPLAPTPAPRAPRPPFPRSGRAPDLYRAAITARMRCSPEGQQILLMGARLAVSIAAATKELERIVSRQGQQEAEREDVVMGEACEVGPVGPGVGNSWVFVPGEDWEMVDCAA